MNKKLQLLLGVIVLIGCLMNTPAFADQDYHERNVFNRMSDWSATMWKSPEEKQRIIDQRVEMRAQRREAYAHKHMHEDRNNGHDNDHDHMNNFK